jgi:ornithine carbamoyltransferase
LRLAYVGDGNNVCHSLMLLGAPVGVEVAVACPPDFMPNEEIVGEAGDRVSVGEDPRAAAKGAHALYTDVWVSMGDEAEADARRAALAPYRLDEALLAEARDDAIVLHCLPAHPGEEITEGLLYGDRSAVWDQAENRLHAQKALLELLLG